MISLYKFIFQEEYNVLSVYIYINLKKMMTNFFNDIYYL